MANPPHTPFWGLRLTHSALQKVIEDCYVRLQKCGSQMSKKSRYRNFEEKAGTVLLHDGEKQVPGSLRKQARDSLSGKKQVRNRSLTEKAAANSKNTNQVEGVDGRDL